MRAPRRGSEIDPRHLRSHREANGGLAGCSARWRGSVDIIYDNVMNAGGPVALNAKWTLLFILDT